MRNEKTRVHAARRGVGSIRSMNRAGLVELMLQAPNKGAVARGQSERGVAALRFFVVGSGWWSAWWRSGRERSTLLGGGDGTGGSVWSSRSEAEAEREEDAAIRKELQKRRFPIIPQSE